MFIRSQDKKGLVDAKRIVIMEDKKIINLVKYGSSDYEDYDSLGIYSTKERAIEVLDEIQEFMVTKEQLRFTNDNDFAYFTVCDMPKE